MQLSLQQHQLQAEKIELKTPALLGQGKGIIDLNRMECNVDINLNSTDQRYQNLTLPINFLVTAILHNTKLILRKIPPSIN